MYSQTVSALPKGTILARYVRALGLHKGHMSDAAAYAEERWKDSPSVFLTLKAYVPAMSTTGAGSPLMTYGIAQELIELVRGASILGRLSDRMRRVPFRTTISRELTSASSQWIGETVAKPVTNPTFASVNMEAYKTISMVIFTVELLRRSDPAADAVIRRQLIRAVAEYLDQQFLDPTVSAVTGVKPASITNGATAVTSTGSTLAQIETDLRTMLDNLGSWENPIWILRPKTGALLATKLGAPGMGPNILGFPFVASTNVGARIVLVDVDDLLLADDGEADLVFYTKAAVLMDDNPQASPQTTELVSLWQHNYVGILAERYIAWLRGHDTSVTYMNVSY